MTALSTTAKKWKQPKCPLRDDWINKVFTYNGTLVSLKKKKKGNLTYDKTWINLEKIILSEISQS